MGHGLSYYFCWCFNSFLQELGLVKISRIKVGELEATEGFFTYYFDEDEDKLWLRIDELNQEFLYANYLAAGLALMI